MKVVIGAKVKHKPLFAVHVCCGRKRKVRFIDGEYVTQPHKCSDASDVAGIDWKALHEQFGRYYAAQIAAKKESA